MLEQTSVKKQRSFGWTVALLISVMTATAFASKGLVQDRRVTMEQAQALAEKAQRGTEFPITVNELVLAQLNRFVGTPEGREFMRKSLQRMENYKVTIGDQLVQYHLPEELFAVPITESGYQNLAPTPKHQSAGLWQIIPGTARRWGLAVDESKDERLDVKMSTDAALRYLLSNRLRFQDWTFAVLAYNMGENAVQEAIDKTGSRDPWALIRKGYEGDKDYLARVMASVIILKNPDLVE